MRLKNLLGIRLVIGLAILSLAGVVVAIRDPFDIDDRPHIERVLALLAKSAQKDIAADMEARTLAQVRLAQLGTIPELSEAEWQSAAGLFLAHHPGYLSVQVWDETHNPVRFTARDSDAAMQLPKLQEVIRHLLSASSTRWKEEPAAAATFQAQNGRSACLVVVPSFIDGKLAGFLAAVFDVQQTLDYILSDHSELGYSVAVKQDGTEIYQMKGGSSDHREAWTQTTHVRLADLDWTVEVWPQPEMLAEFRSRLPELGFILAMLPIVLIAPLVHFSRVLHVKSVQLRAAHDELEVRVQQRTAELRKANQLLATEQENLRHLSARLLSLQDEERRRIARELHDSTAQILSTLGMNLGRLRKLVPNDGSKLRAIIDDSEQLASQSVSEIRTMSYLLHPAALDDLGLGPVLRWYAGGFAQRSGIEVELDIAPDLRRLPADLELTLFRIVQEALGNIHRHSGSRTARIAVSCNSDEVVLLVADQGCGVPARITHPERATTPSGGVGIASMRERVRQFDGKLAITSDGHGTVITVVIPVAEPQSLASAA